MLTKRPDWKKLGLFSRDLEPALRAELEMLWSISIHFPPLEIVKVLLCQENLYFNLIKFT